MKVEFKVVDWANSHKWLVAITGKDGSYTPLLQLRRDGDGTAPTYRNQLYQAARLLEDGGIAALDNPHGMIGRSCRCGNCFTCAAAEIVRRAEDLGV